MNKHLIEALLRLVLLLSPFISYSAENDTTTSALNLYFESGVYKLDSASSVALESFLVVLEKPFLYSITIAASTDSVGSIKYNQKLANKRANYIVDHLDGLGLDMDAVEIVILGEQTRSSLLTGESLWKNRVTTITIRQFDYLSDYKAPTQRFSINPAMLNVLTGAKGTKVIIPANSIVRQNGAPIFGSIEVILEEYYTKEDFVLNGIHTSSENQVIESGGALNLRAMQNEQELRIRDGMELQIKMPANEVVNDMKAFFGSQKDSTDALVDWHLEEENGSVAANKLVVDFNRAEELLRQTVRDMNLSEEEQKFLEFFGEPGNETELGILLGNSVRKMDSDQLQRLVERYEIDILMAGKETDIKKLRASFYVRGRKYIGSGILYKKSTKRKIDLKEETFEKFSFPTADGVQFIKEENRHQIALTEEMLDFNSTRKIQNYFMTTAKLGWINCDRFLNSPSMQLADLEVEFDPKLKGLMKINLVLKDANAVMPPQFVDENRIRFKNVPVGMEATLFGHTVKDNEILSVIQNITISSKLEKAEIKPITKEDFADALVLLSR